MALSCTPNDILAYEPCTACLADSELLSILALLLCHIQNGPRDACDPKALLEDSACFECLNDHQMLVAMVNMFYQFAVEGGFIEAGELREQGVCLNCLPPRQIRAILLKFLCDYLQSQQALQ